MGDDRFEPLVSALCEVDASIESLAVSGAVGEGVRLDLSNKLAGVYNSCRAITQEAARDAAFGVAQRVLVYSPHLAGEPTYCEMLCSDRFCTELVLFKVEVIRIERGEPQLGPALTPAETASLYDWAERLGNAALDAWQPYFACFGPLGFCNHETPYQVPRRFRALVCTLVQMSLDLWPTIKNRLDSWKIEGPNIFAKDLWSDPTVTATISAEPRMIPFIVQADIDMNQLAPAGPSRRSSAPHLHALAALSADEQRLVHGGVLWIRANYRNARIHKQRKGWRAALFEWPRSSTPQARGLFCGVHETAIGDR